MYKIAIVEDEHESAENLLHCFDEYTRENGIQFNTVRFKNGLDFLDGYTTDFDMVFMDVDMPQMNGLKVAKELRKRDSTVVLIFVTFLAKYAIKGYEVDALDYVIKPVNYNAFKIKIERALKRCEQNEKLDVMLPLVGGAVRMEISQLNYVEVYNHDIIYHTHKGMYKAYGTMREVEKMLSGNIFCKCNRCYLINLRNVTRIEGNFVVVGEDKLAISRPRKQAFIDALHEYGIASMRRQPWGGG